jgi:hypothetical protein
MMQLPPGTPIVISSTFWAAILNIEDFRVQGEDLLANCRVPA